MSQQLYTTLCTTAAKRLRTLADDLEKATTPRLAGEISLQLDDVSARLGVMACEWKNANRKAAA